MSDALREELAAMKEELAGSKHVYVESAFAQLVRVHIGVTPVRCLTCCLHFPEGYPEENSLGVELTAERLDPDMVAKLQNGVEKEMSTSHAGKPQILPTIRWLEKFLTSNKLLPCYPEIKKLKELLPDAATSLKLADKAGRVSATLSQGEYKVTVQLVVPDAYPSESPTLEITSSNFSKDVSSMFEMQARELIRRMKEGYSPAAAMAEEANKLRPPEKVLAKMAEFRVDLSAEGLQTLKSDREFLNSYAQVRGSHEERKNRRIMVHKQGKQDKEKEAAKADKEALMEQTIGKEPVPSVFEAIAFLARAWVWKMPGEVCPLSSKPILPDDPKEMVDKTPLGEVRTQKQIQSAASVANPPDLVRIYCGHWYHYSALDPYMRKPPFDKRCAADGCGKVIFHPLWTSNKSLLEKRWAYEESKRTEIEEVADFLGVEVDSEALEKEIRAGKI